MSAKARASEAWDRQHLTGVLLPVRWVVRAFSSITLAVVLLLLVVVFCISASIPIGLLALIPTYLVYALTLIATTLVLGSIPLLAWLRARKSSPSDGHAALSARGVPVLLLGAVLIAPVASWLWWKFLWPVLDYHEGVHDSGLRFFAAFAEANKDITLRRLPGFEMSELEFYAWWPLKTLLLLFVINMITATLRRIEFNFKNIGVLTVHTGIVTISLGSVYYAGLKLEGDTVLLAGNVDEKTGQMGVGPPQMAFYDNMSVALYVDQSGSWEQRPIQGVPRYNDYNLGAIDGQSVDEVVGRPRTPIGDSLGALDIPVPNLPNASSDLQFRAIGYASYAQPVTEWVAGAGTDPLRTVYIHSDLPDKNGKVNSGPVFAFTIPPADKVLRHGGTSVFAIEYTQGMPEERWRDLSEEIPSDAAYALVVEVPAADATAPSHREVIAAVEGRERAIGTTGFTVTVKQLAEEPPFPIVTPGYKGATSSMAVVTIKSPKGEVYDRWVYHRYPEIAQDLLNELNERGMPRRRDPDSSIRVSLIDAKAFNVYFDETNGKVRAIVRGVGGSVRVIDSVPIQGEGAGWVRDVVPQIHLRLGERFENVAKVERPGIVPDTEKDRNRVGNHQAAMLCVEVTSTADASLKRVVWLPFSQYLDADQSNARTLTLPNGRTVRLAFGRVQHPFPDFAISLVDFQMVAYDFRGSPRDYQSMVRVMPLSTKFEPFDHLAKLNEPLRAPQAWHDEASLFENVVGRLTSGLSPRQFKLSQAGWDQGTWTQTQKLADQGLLQRPNVRFTILHVGNNPGIHIIALGGILMGVGIPWAFYVKPWLVRREKTRIQKALADGTYVRPNLHPSPSAPLSSSTSGTTPGAMS